MSQRIYDLEDRLVEFSSHVIDVVEALPTTRAANYIAVNWFAAVSLQPYCMEKPRGPSQETTSLRRKMVTSLDVVSKENDELIAIIAKSIDTARRNKEPAGRFDYWVLIY